MKTTALAVLVLMLCGMVPAFGQQMSAADQEMMKVRQAMSDQYAEAVAKKNAAAMADHYTADVLTASLCPESAPVVGRDALAKRGATSEKGVEALRNGLL